MTIRHIMTINDVKYYIPNKIFEKAHKHRKPVEWVTLWFYKNRKRTFIENKNITTDKEITSKLEYNINTFYKMTTLSAEDDYFDYFYRLKPTVDKGNILKKNNRYKRRGNSKLKKHFKGVEYGSDKPHKWTDDGKIIVEFK